MHVRTSFAGTWEVFILPRQSDRGRRGKDRAQDERAAGKRRPAW